MEININKEDEEELTKLSKDELIEKIKIVYHNMDIDTERIEQLEEENEKLKEENEHYKDLMYALETYYTITEEDLEESIKEDC